VRLLRRTAAAVALALVAGTALSACEATDLPLPGSPVDKDAAIQVRVEFNDVLNLVVRSPVKVNDVTVGEVVELERVGWHAAATLRIQDDVELPGNAVAQIRQTSLLGEKYVALEAPEEEPADGTLSDGDVIGLDRTDRNPELEEVLGALSFLLNGGGVGQLETITRELNAVFDGRRDRLRHVLGELDTLVSTLDLQKDDIIAAMESMNGLARTLNREKRTVTRAIDAFGPAVTVLADHHDELIRMLGALDRLGRVGTRVIDATQEDLMASLRHLRPVLREIANVDSELPEALGLLISFPFPIESNDIVHGDYANTDIVFSIDLDQFLRNMGGDPDGGDDGPGLPGLPELPELPGVPQVPGAPEVPEVPDILGLGRAGALGGASYTGGGSAESLGELLGSERR
jgi:phospholipid/cholesterol/gamma-HCH transport system substrate-binding protein